MWCTQKAEVSADKLRECDSDKGEGGKKIRKFCGCHLSMAPRSKRRKLCRERDQESRSLIAVVQREFFLIV